MENKIIVIEGTDGSGKKTQTDLLYKYLQNSGKKVARCSFPNYESASSAPVKMYLNGELGENANCLDAYQASVLFATDRLCTWQQLKQKHKENTIILLDRYVQSNMVHQAGKIINEQEREKFLNWLDKLEFEDLKLSRPNKVIFLNMPPKMSITLANARTKLKAGTKKDIHEQDKDHLINAYNAGMWVAKKYGWNIIDCVTKDGRLKSIDEIHKEIVDLI